MEAKKLQPEASPAARINWESFYANYRKAGYVSGFEIINKLGGGVFGMVFKARKESIGKDYAIKFLKVDDETVRDAVVRELASVHYFAQIDHPNLVSIEDKGEVDGIPFIVMSYAGEGTLRKRLEQAPLSRDEALRVFTQAARGVQALHERSLVHFDLKPANIFLKGEIARVGDYGLSKLITESRNSLSFGRGTPYYMAPEMLQRRGDARSDIYSLGVILYECLTGSVPFRGDSEWEVLRKHETEPPVYPDQVQHCDRAILARCLAKNPDHRFQTVTDLLHALQAPASLGESIVITNDPRFTRRGPPPPPPPVVPLVQPLVGRPAPRVADVIASTAAPSNQRMGPIGSLVHGLFRALELVVAGLLVPVRAVSLALARAIVLVLKLPFKILGVTAQLLGYILIAAVVLLVMLGVYYVFSWIT